MKTFLLHIFFMLALVQCTFAQKQISLNFTGRIDFGRNTGKSISDTINPFAQTQEAVNNGCPTFTTIGTVFLDTSSGKSRMLVSNKAVSASTRFAQVLSDNGFKGISASNKLVGEYGFEGLASTSEALQKNSLMFAGIRSFCESTIIEHEGCKIGFASFGNSPYAPSISDSIKITQTTSRLDSLCDIVVIAFSIDNSGLLLTHGTTNKQPYINAAERFAKMCINFGADIVYGDGASTPQGIELYNERLIIYGLGNFFTPTIPKFGIENGCAPVLSVTTYPDGTFCKANIHSFRQTTMQGLVADEEMNAIKIIKECTKAINPEALFDIKEDGTVLPKHKSNATLVLELLAEGYTHIGKKYRRGSVGPQLFDCSGFTSYIYRKIGIELFRTSNSQYTQGEKVDKENLKPGDLVFFRGSASRGIGHVGVVVSVDKAEKSFKFIHASNRGVIIDDFAKSSYYIRRYVGATRIIGYLDISKPQ